jgi:hypothetical protein
MHLILDYMVENVSIYRNAGTFTHENIKTMLSARIYEYQELIRLLKNGEIIGRGVVIP